MQPCYNAIVEGEFESGDDAGGSEPPSAPELGASSSSGAARPKRKYDPTSGSDRNSPFAHAVRALGGGAAVAALVPAAVSLAGTATTVFYYWRSYMAVTGVIDAIAVEVYHVVDAAGEEAVTWLRFAGSTSRIGFGVLLVGLTAMAFFTICIWAKGILREFT